MNSSCTRRWRFFLLTSISCAIFFAVAFQSAVAQHRLLKRNVLTDSIAWVPQNHPMPDVAGGDAIFFDYNNDGRLDVLIAGIDSTGRPVSGIYANDSLNGFFNIKADLIPLATERGMAWGDLDNDGDYDIALEGNPTPGQVGTSVSRVYRNEGGLFVNAEAPLVNLSGGSVAWADYNNDGHADLFVCGSPDAGGSFDAKLYKNINGVLQQDPAILPGVWGSAVGWADYDRDGDLDLLISGYGWGMQTRLFRNDLTDSSQSFVEVPAPVEGMYPFEAVSSSSLAWFDYDNDGWPDLLLTGGGYNGVVSKIYHNDQQGTFHDIGAALAPVTVSALAVGDYDNDGYLDLAIEGGEDFTYGTHPTTRIYHNNGGQSFTDIGAHLTGTWWGSLEWGDYDNDGRLDLLVTGPTMARDSMSEDLKYLKPVTILYRNTVVVDSNCTPETPSGLGAAVEGKSVTLSWDAAADAETPQAAVSYNVRIGTTPGGIDAMSPLSNTATGYRRVPKSGNVGMHTSATVRNLPPGTYTWSVQSVDNQLAASHFSPERTFTISATSVVKPPALPATSALYQNYPNPFNPETGVRFQVSGVGNVELKVFDLLGREVATLVNEVKQPGTYTVRFNAAALASGIYFYRLTAGQFTATRSMMLVK